MRALWLLGLAVTFGCHDRKGIRLREGEKQLFRLQNNAKRFFAEVGAFPVGVVPLTPEAPCCREPNQRCVTSPETWQHPVWKTLAFHIDEPHLFQYMYQSDGKTFTANAVGDPDCKGTPITIVMTANVANNGNPEFTLIIPPY